MRAVALLLATAAPAAGQAPTPAPTGWKYRCTDEGGCVHDPDGSLSPEECQATCKTPPPTPAPPTPPPTPVPAPPTPPPTPAPVYACDTDTYTCKPTDPGKGSSKEVCEQQCKPATPAPPPPPTPPPTPAPPPPPTPPPTPAPPPPPLFACNTTTYTCDPSEPGKGTSKEVCEQQCAPVPTPPPTPLPTPVPPTPHPTPVPPTPHPTPVPTPTPPELFACNTTTYTCDPSEPGKGASKEVCERQCVRPTPAPATPKPPVTPQPAPTPPPTPPPLFACNTTTYTCDPSEPGKGASQEVCELQCKRPTPAPPTSPPTPVPPAPIQCSRNLDLLFVLDGSGSIHADSWEIDINATGTIADSFKFGCSADPSAAEAEMGIVQFSDQVRIEQPLTCDKAAFMTRLGSIQKFDSYTYTGDALEKAAEEFAGHGREDDYKAVILITDGVPCTPATVLECDKNTPGHNVPDPTQAAKARQVATQLKGSSGADIISIAVGDFGDLGLQFIVDISSEPASKYVFNPSTWEQLPALINSIIASICPPSPAAARTL